MCNPLGTDIRQRKNQIKYWLAATKDMDQVGNLNLELIQGTVNISN